MLFKSEKIEFMKAIALVHFSVNMLIPRKIQFYQQIYTVLDFKIIYRIFKTKSDSHNIPIT